MATTGTLMRLALFIAPIVPYSLTELTISPLTPLSSRALIGLDNMGTTIGNAFRVEQKPMMSVKEGQKAFRELSLDTDTMKQGRARTAASYQESKRNNAIEKVINDPTTSPEEQFTLLLNLGLSKSAAKKASGYR